MDTEFHSILLKYDGLDASNGLLELGQLGKSIEGASRLLGIAGHIVATGVYAKQAQAISVRVMVAPPRRGSVDLPAILMTAVPAIAPVFPTIADITKKAATKAVEAIVNHVISKAGGKESEAKMALEIVDKAMRELGHTSRAAIGAVERVAVHNKLAIRMFVAPVGESCATAQIGNIENGAILIDTQTREVIDAPEPIEIGKETQFDVFISELDLKTQSCKVTFRGSEDPTHRINGEITDPQVRVPENAYSKAFNAQKFISVKGKAQIKDGEIDRIFISDVASS